MSHQQCIPWSPPLEIKPVTTECKAETLPLQSIRSQYTLLMKSDKVKTAVQLFRMSLAVLIGMVIWFISYLHILCFFSVLWQGISVYEDVCFFFVFLLLSFNFIVWSFEIVKSTWKQNLVFYLRLGDLFLSLYPRKFCLSYLRTHSDLCIFHSSILSKFNHHHHHHHRFTHCEFFTPALIGSFSLKSEWQ